MLSIAIIFSFVILAWGDLDLVESVEEYEEDNNNEDSVQYLEAVAEMSVACKPGLMRHNNTCLGTIFIAQSFVVLTFQVIKFIILMGI